MGIWDDITAFAEGIYPDAKAFGQEAYDTFSDPVGSARTIYDTLRDNPSEVRQVLQPLEAPASMVPVVGEALAARDFYENPGLMTAAGLAAGLIPGAYAAKSFFGLGADELAMIGRMQDSVPERGLRSPYMSRASDEEFVRNLQELRDFPPEKLDALKQRFAADAPPPLPPRPEPPPVEDTRWPMPASLKPSVLASEMPFLGAPSIPPRSTLSEFLTNLQVRELVEAAALREGRTLDEYAWRNLEGLGPDDAPFLTFHGRHTDFPEFSPESIGSASGDGMVKGYWSSIEPDEAEIYANQFSDRLRPNANIMPLYTRAQNPGVVFADNKIPGPNAIRRALDQGHDAIIAFNAKDPLASMTHVMTTQPNQYRVPWAKFDPKSRESGDLLAGLGGLGLTSMYATRDE